MNRTSKPDEFNILTLVKKVRRYRWFFLISIVICLAGAFFYNRFSIPVYKVRATVLIDEQGEVSKTANLLYGSDLPLAPIDKSLYNEIAKLQSYPFILRTVEALNLRISYYQSGFFSDFELYHPPFSVELDSVYDNPVNANLPFQVTILSKEEYQLDVNWEHENTPSVVISKRLPFNKFFTLNGSKLQISSNELTGASVGESYYFVLNNLEDLAKRYKEQLDIRAYNQEASVIDIQLETGVPEKELRFLDEFVYQYITYNLENKNLSTSQSLEFIDEQLAITYDTLRTIEQTLENFKTRTSFSESSSIVDRSLDKISELESERASLIVNKKYLDNLLQYINENKELDRLVAPASMGIQDLLLNNMINQLVELQIEKNTYLTEGSRKNPYVKDIETKVENIKIILNESIKNLYNSNEILTTQINQRISKIEKDLSAVPETERRYVNIKRIYDLNEEVYNLLLQKRVEAGIALASATADSKIIEPAYLESKEPLSPRKYLNFALALFAGIFFPSAFIFAKDTLSVSIKDKNDIMRRTDVPILGVIGKNSKKFPLVVKQQPRSAIAESFRIVRANLKYIHNDKSKKVYLLSSSVSNEGKSFCSINLAIALAYSGKKTLLLDGDLRKRKSLSGFNIPDDAKGLTHYLVQDATLDEIVRPSGVENLDIIPSGAIPPNPSELLMNDRMEILMEVLQPTYEYIVIDTAPIGMVTDPQALMRFSTHNIYVVRSGFTHKDAITQLDDMVEQGILKNVTILLNDVKTAHHHYGYGKYGYGDFQENRKKKFFSS